MSVNKKEETFTNEAVSDDERIEEIEELVGVAHRRNLSGINKIIAIIIGLSMTFFHMYTAGFGLYEAIIQRSVHLSFALTLAFLLYPFKRGKKENKIPFYDYILACLGAYAPLYVVANYQDLIFRAGYVTTMDFVTGIILIVLVFEAARRIVGPVLPSICAFFLGYAYFGQYIPGTFGHRGFTLRSIVRHMFLTTEGIFGIAIGVTASFIFLFILFGVILSATGTGQIFIDISMRLFGKAKGGPAKAAVVASSLFGTINGSSVANIMGTGLFTIPLMKKSGYKPHFAGGVEAAASTGGQIMPPLMGAGAFIMAEFLGISYLTVALAAALPAILYYIGVFSAVHIEANKQNLSGISLDMIPTYREVVSKLYLLVPIVVLLFYLLRGYTPTRAAFVSILFSLAINVIFKNRLSLKEWIKVLSEGAFNSIELITAVAVIGFIIGTASLTGLALKVAGTIVSIAGANIMFALLLTHFVCILLGMGLPTTAKYIMVAMMAVPALVNLGIVPIAAHMFVFYYAILSDITPPVALGSLAAAGVAQADHYKTSFSSIKLALSGFIVPYFFVLSPRLLLGTVSFSWDVAVVAITAIVSVFFLSAAAMDWLFCKLTVLQRVMLLGGSIMMISPKIMTDISGVLLVAVAVFLNYKTKNKLDILAS